MVTAEDIGKMPDKNVADSLARLPGITTSAAGANEGGFDENDRVSMRGTNPSLTQTLINGHSVAAGDWFVLDQIRHGRTQRQLHPAALGNRQQGGGGEELQRLLGGRRRRGFGRHHHAQAARFLQAVHPRSLGRRSVRGSALEDRPHSSAPSALSRMMQAISASWCSCSPRRGTCAATASKCWATTRLRRCQTTAIATGNPDLVGVQYPHEIGAAFFTQNRERNGGLVDIEFKPADNDTLDLSAFSSRLLASNYNRNYLFWPTHFLNAGAGQAPLPGYTVAGNTLTSANFAPVAGTDLWRLRPDFPAGRRRHRQFRQSG